MSKKTRGPNFTTNEKEILISLITKYRDVVENKKTDAASLATKNEVWVKLTEEFNSQNTLNCTRTTDQLKTCWDNIKRMTRKRKAAIKKQILTGGVRPDFPPPVPFQGQVEAILGSKLEGLENVHDSDSDYELMERIDPLDNKEDIELLKMAETSEGEDSITSSIPKEIERDSGSEQEGSLKTTWSNCTPKRLKAKVSNTLSKNGESKWQQRRRLKASLQDAILKSKLELIEIVKKNAVDEGELKSNILQEQLKQEKIKTEMLQLQLSNIKIKRIMTKHNNRL